MLCHTLKSFCQSKKNKIKRFLVKFKVICLRGAEQQNHKQCRRLNVLSPIILSISEQNGSLPTWICFLTAEPDACLSHSNYSIIPKYLLRPNKYQSSPCWGNSFSRSTSATDALSAAGGVNWCHLLLGLLCATVKVRASLSLRDDCTFVLMQFVSILHVVHLRQTAK